MGFQVNKGILGSVIDHIQRYCLESLKGNMCWCQDSWCGISVVGIWATTFIKQPIASLKGNQERIWPLVVHRNKIIKFGVYKDLNVKIILVTIFLSSKDFNNSHWVCMSN